MPEEMNINKLAELQEGLVEPENKIDPNEAVMQRQAEQIKHLEETLAKMTEQLDEQGADLSGKTDENLHKQQINNKGKRPGMRTQPIKAGGGAQKTIEQLQHNKSVPGKRTGVHPITPTPPKPHKPTIGRGQ